ncbi:MAG: translocation/assembly module TamB domain-containing protein [Acetobacteraceae bacterium]
MIRRIAVWTGIAAACVVGLLAIVAILVFFGANTGPGRQALAWLLPRATGGEIHASGISGDFPFTIRARLLTVSDTAGPWLETRNFSLDWEPAQLLHGRIIVDRLKVTRALVLRLPQQRSSSPSRSSAKHAKPTPLLVRHLAIDHLVLGPKLAATEPSFSVHGSVRRDRNQGEAVSLEAVAADGGRYTLEAKRNARRVTLQLHVTEPAHGPLATLAKLPDLGPLRITAALAGPTDAIAANVRATAGPLTLAGNGTLDLARRSADLSLSADAPAMHPRADLGWQKVALSATVHGTLARPVVAGHLTIADLEAAGAKIAGVDATASGAGGKLRLTATFSGVTLPGSAPALLSGAPLVLDARANLDAPGRPVEFTLRHPLITAHGKLRATKNFSVSATISLPELAPFAKLAGTTIDGSASVDVTAAQREAGLAIGAKGDVAISGGPAPLRALLGSNARLDLAAIVHGKEIALAKFSLRGRHVLLDADGRLGAKAVALTFTGDLKDLSVINKRVAGSLAARGRIHGSPKNLAVEADLDGMLGMANRPPRAIHVKLAASGLPRAPAAELSGKWVLAGAPLDLSFSAERSADGALALAIHKATWKSASAKGTLHIGKSDKGTGRITFSIGRLADFSTVLGTPLKGSLAGTLSAARDPSLLVLNVQGDRLGSGTASIGRAVLAATLTNPLRSRRLNAKLTLSGIQAAGTSNGSATLIAAGPENALALTLNAATPAFGAARLEASAVADVAAGSATISALTAGAHGATVGLLAPARIAFLHGIAIDRARLGMDGAELDINGRISPRLALDVAIRNVTPTLLARFEPGLAAKGRLDAGAHLAGTLARPEGTFHVHASNLGLASPSLAGLPPASVTLTASLGNRALKLRGEVSAGAGSRIAISGTAPLARDGKLDLAARGAIDLALLDPVLAAEGRRIEGRLTLDATVGGTMAAPRLAGSARLSDGMIRDYANGVSITNIAGDFEANGATLRIVRLDGKADTGSIGIAGTIGILSPGVPIALRITANDALLLQSDRMRVRLDSKLAVDGAVERRLSVNGKIRILRAEIRIPKRLPASIPVLDVVRPGNSSPRRAAPFKPPLIALDIFLQAPRQVFVRGRGIDAEFGGQMHVTGTSAAPKIIGSLRLIRGQVSLAGETLTFTQGTIGFNGGDVTDPTLDLVATTSTATTTATLTLGGTARHPTVTLSSTPELPQDQILATLLFGGSASALSPFQVVEIANALASLSGAGPSVGNPLGTVRKGLGLDQLTIGSGPNGSTTLQAGRYVAPGVYVGASQATNGAGTSANVVVNLSKHLKLKARVGDRATGNAVGSAADQSTSVGLSYQFEY